MRNNLILFLVFFIVLFFLNLLFLMKPLYQSIGGCDNTNIFPCLISIKLFLMFLSYTIFDFFHYTVIFYLITMTLFLITRSVTVNKYYKHMFLFIFIKMILFLILFFRDLLPVNFIYLFFISMFLFYLAEVRLAYNELIIGDSRGRFLVTLIPSGIIGFVKVGAFFIVYPIGLMIVTWQLYSRMLG